MQQTKRVPSWTVSANANIPNPTYAGRHLVADFWHGRDIESERELKRLLKKAAEVACSKALKISIFKFSPQGITGVILLAESHIAIHTWPEIGYMAVDVFTCGAQSRPREALEFLKNELQPKESEIREMKRGFHKSQNLSAS
ncbi:MAG: adenosylmethionine decarboxylase [bacterium]|nr:adenosylmethionine decarboxylase [bacterium]